MYCSPWGWVCVYGCDFVHGWMQMCVCEVLELPADMLQSGELV